MQYMEYDINVLSIVVLLIILFNSKAKFKWDSYKYKLFITLVYSNILLLIMDTIIFIYQGGHQAFVRPLLLVVAFVYYVFNPIAAFLWVIFVDYHFNNSKPKFNKKLAVLIMPILISTVISLLSIFNGYYFYLDGNNVYHRGPVFYGLFIISYSYLIYAFLLTFKARKKINRHGYISFLYFPVFPTLGGILQALFYGTSLIWPGMAISILIIYLFIQNDSMSKDYLTDIYNHGELDSFLQNKIKNPFNSNKIAGIMLDIDDFKNINDRYGHSIGDEALKNMADILKSIFRADDFIARYGGDEFFVVLEISDENLLNKAVDRIYKNIEEFNQLNHKQYELKVSLGSSIYDRNSNMSANEFINEIDRLMYSQKGKR